MKTGTNTGIIINTRSREQNKVMQKENKKKSKRAEVCIGCEFNDGDGWCKKHKDWGYKVNYICLGIEDPYKKFNNGYNWGKYRQKNNKKIKFKKKKRK